MVHFHICRRLLFLLLLLFGQHVDIVSNIVFIFQRSETLWQTVSAREWKSFASLLHDLWFHLYT